MALLGFEGFDNWSTAPSGASTPDFIVTAFTTGLGGASGGVWLGVGSGFTTVKVAGLLGGSAIQITAGFPPLQLGSTFTTLILGARVNMLLPTAITNDIFRFLDGTNVQCGLSRNLAGNLIFWRGTNATVLATGASVIILSTWNMIEISATINNTTGAVEVRLNGVLELTATGLNTRTTANNQATGFALAQSNTGTLYDDLYAVDTTGSPPYNTFLTAGGDPVRVETLFVTTNNSVTFTPLSSTNASQVDEVNFDRDTTYNASDTPGNIDTFNHGALSSTPVTIFAVDVCAYARKDDVTVQNVRTKLISGVTTVNGATNPQSTQYQSSRTSYLTDPNTSAAWTGSNVNATQIGYEHV